MKDFFADLKMLAEDFGTTPTLEDMPKRSLADKGIKGPTAAHVIEEVHCPLNLAYLTFTTGSSAFQNIVGITYTEIDNRVKAARLALEKAEVKKGAAVLFTYPPLVNVFSKRALDEYGLKWSFLRRSDRDEFLYELCEMNPDVIIGESSFLRAALEDAKRMEIVSYLPQDRILLAAGAPLDMELLQVAEETMHSKVHDLYGCQEFGWLMLDGEFLRDDISLLKIPDSREGYYEVTVGGLPMGDSFPVAESGHVCNKEGKVITYRRKRTYPEYEVFVRATTLSSCETIKRVARTILRIKSRIVRIEQNIKLSAPFTVLEVQPITEDSKKSKSFLIEGPEKTQLFDELVKAQLNYQQSSKTDPAWTKKG